MSLSSMTDSVTGESTEATVTLYIDSWVNKESTRPDVLDYIFITTGPSSVMTAEKTLWHYAVIDNGEGGE